MMQDSGMGHRFHRRSAHECRKPQVDHSDFIAMVLEIGPQAYRDDIKRTGDVVLRRGTIDQA